ncbi:hypothetical protein [Sinorhizobium meliloti]|uniref:hypothetical protein n=1 Tax=Rhizobium meliloti TaxID=382 RepID=UPI003F16E2DD
MPVGVEMRPSYKPNNVLFAFESDLRRGADGELARYKAVDHYEAEEREPVLTAFCIVGKGYWYYDRKARGWGFLPSDERHQEVLAFLGGMANSIPPLMAGKGRPKFGEYLIDGTSGFTVVT